ncbi:MAG: T9SS type A sorting domain-containing protein [Cyclobacteriaceae bacterium]
MHHKFLLSVILLVSFGFFYSCEETPSQLEAEVVFFPNPFIDQLSVEIAPEKEMEVEIHLYSATLKGQFVPDPDTDPTIENPVYRGTLSEGRHKIMLNLSQLSEGIYFLHVSGGGSAERFEVIKKDR